jgi:hypothetical protein
MTRIKLMAALSMVAAFSGIATLIARSADIGTPPVSGAAPAGAAVAATPAAGAKSTGQVFDHASFVTQVKPFFAKYCIECHTASGAEKDIPLDAFSDQDALTKGIPNLEKAALMLQQHKMPPKEQPQPTEAERKSAIDWLEAFTSGCDCSDPKSLNPGRVTLRRLNRAEYNNTIRDLLAIDSHPADAFPIDDAGYGFDNIGDVLSIPPVLMEKYMTAAENVVHDAIFVDPVTPPPSFRWDANSAEGTVPKTSVKPVDLNAGPVNQPDPGNGRIFYYNGEIHAEYNFPADGTYYLRLNGYSNPGTNARGRTQMQFLVDGKPFGRPITINDNQQLTKVYGSEPVFAKAGKHLITLALISSGTKEEYDAAVAAAKKADAAAATQPAGQGGVAVGRPGAAAGQAGTAGRPGAAGGRSGAAGAQAGARSGATATQPAASLGSAATRPSVLAAAGAATRPGAATQPGGAVAGNPPGRGRGARPPAGARGAQGVQGLQGVQGAGRRGGLPPAPPPPTGQATVGVHFFEVEGPMEPNIDRMPESYRRVMVALPSATVTKQQAAEQIIRNFATRAFRRPVTDQEFNRLLALWTSYDAQGDKFEDSISSTLSVVLVSPYFLYHMEADPTPAEGVRTIDEYELASRLSYFLWSTMPDDELESLAAQGKLRENLDAQIDRMLKDPKSRALVDNFAGQWLQLRLMDTVNPDPKIYPDFDPALRQAMITETQMFFDAIVKQNRSVLDFIDADYTFVNERLARHYGMPGIKGDQFREVKLDGTDRGGLLTQGSILTITSYSIRTSPVQRGKWVLENLLDAAPPPPPPNVPALNDETQIKGTLRQRMMQHRANPVCASCHEQMDAIGFGLENFDGIGAWRTQDADAPIDATGVLPGGITFNGPAELKKVLMAQSDAFCRCLTSRLMTYATGRGMEKSDRCYIDPIVNKLPSNGYKFSVLVREIVYSDPFQKRSVK